MALLQVRSTSLLNIIYMLGAGHVQCMWLHWMHGYIRLHTYTALNYTYIA